MEFRLDTARDNLSALLKRDRTEDVKREIAEVQLAIAKMELEIAKANLEIAELQVDIVKIEGANPNIENARAVQNSALKSMLILQDHVNSLIESSTILPQTGKA